MKGSANPTVVRRGTTTAVRFPLRANPARAPIDIPAGTKGKFKEKQAGYDQWTFKWSEGPYNYQARYHGETPGAPKGWGPTWVVMRITPGTPTGQNRREEILTGKTWTPMVVWMEAVFAHQAGKASPEQDALLKSGHIANVLK